MDATAGPPFAIPTYPPSTLWERALDLIFPPTCVGCRRVGRWICADCWLRVRWLPPARCRLCGRTWIADTCASCDGGADDLDSLTAVAVFDDVAREAVHALKYYGHHAISGTMGRTMAGVFTDFPVDKVSPVPLHRSRRRQRGYDQADLLARHVATALEVYYEPRTLTRVRNTKQQVGLEREARRRNVESAFQAGTPLDGETILLVDDVVTTGATMMAAAHAAKAAGAGTVHGLAFAAAQPNGLAEDK